MKNIPKISDAEWRVMQVFWSHHPLTANDVAELLGESVEWNPRTIKTLINRLVKKGALGYEVDGRTYLYAPLVEAEDCVRAEGRSFLQRVFRGSLTPMIVHFLEDEKLTDEEIDELKRILEKKRGEEK